MQVSGRTAGLGFPDALASSWDLRVGGPSLPPGGCPGPGLGSGVRMLSDPPERSFLPQGRGSALSGRKLETKVTMVTLSTRHWHRLRCPAGLCRGYLGVGAAAPLSLLGRHRSATGGVGGGRRAAPPRLPISPSALPLLHPLPPRSQACAGGRGVGMGAVDLSGTRAVTSLLMRGTWRPGEGLREDWAHPSCPSPHAPVSRVPPGAPHSEGDPTASPDPARSPAPLLYSQSTCTRLREWVWLWQEGEPSLRPVPGVVGAE